MVLIKKYKWYIVLSFAIVVSFLFLRLINLTYLPIFTDEAIYMRWAQIALNDSAWRFISLTDGKQPSYIWITMVTMKFIDDPLLAGRLISVFAGFFTLVGVWFLSYELFKSKKISFVASILYVFYPFAQVHERLAIYDSLVTAIFVWTTYISILLVRRIRLDLAFILGFLIGAGVLTKSTGFISIYLLPATLLLFNFHKKIFSKPLLKWVLYVLIAIIISQVFYSILRLSPLFHMIAQKNTTFIYPFSEGLKPPFPYLWWNLHGLIMWTIDYLTPFYLVLVFLGLIVKKALWRQKLLLFTYWLVPLVGLAVVGKVLYPRFIFFMSVMLIPIASLGLVYIWDYIAEKTNILKKLKNRYWIIAFVITLFFISYPAYVSLSFALDPINARITDADSKQYVNSWTSGWGVNDTIEILKEKSKDEKIFVGTEGNFGLMPFALELYFYDNPNVTIKGYWPFDQIPEEVIEKASQMPTFMVYYQPDHRNLKEDAPLDLIYDTFQGNNPYTYRLYQVIPKTE